MGDTIQTVYDSINYRIQGDHPIVVTGNEIYNSIRHARLSSDTIIPVLDSAFYSGTTTDTVTYYMQGFELIGKMSEATYYPVMGWEAAMLGFVLGGCLSLINFHRNKDEYALADLGIIAGTLMSGGIMVFFDHSSRLLGSFGVGIGVGFVVFFIITTLLLKSGIATQNISKIRLYEAITGNKLTQ